MKHTLIAICMMICALAPHLAGAQDFTARLQILNQTDITQSPGYKTESEIFAMRVLDNNRQLVGKVDDVRVDDSGSLTALVSEINRVGRDEKTIEVPSYDITFHDDISAFEIPLLLDGTQRVSPESLAAITPAAGGGSIVSLKALIGAETRSEQGRWVGKVDRVIFSADGSSVAALVLQDVPGARRYKKIALPFEPQDVRMISDFGRVEVRLSQDAANAVTAFARANR